MAFRGRTKVRQNKQNKGESLTTIYKNTQNTITTFNTNLGLIFPIERHDKIHLTNG